ncbi:MAG: ribonuclease III, partial [Gammaproteobacteria bacterium]|nr:ribonuclease III [Gammaproteobacteria bacterium]
MTDTLRLQKIIGYEFKDPGLLELALTHRSAGGRNNERLEFLGDSILNHVIADMLFRRFPESREGELSRMRAALVKGDTLAEVAREMPLGEYLKLGSGEKKSGGHRRASILADALEAILGALFLDGGYVECEGCVHKLFEARLKRLSPGAKDAKTRLQEFLQHRGEPLPEYAVVETAGADHDRQFKVTCQI